MLYVHVSIYKGWSNNGIFNEHCYCSNLPTSVHFLIVVSFCSALFRSDGRGSAKQKSVTFFFWLKRRYGKNKNELTYTSSHKKLMEIPSWNALSWTFLKCCYINKPWMVGNIKNLRCLLKKMLCIFILNLIHKR